MATQYENQEVIIPEIIEKKDDKPLIRIEIYSKKPVVGEFNLDKKCVKKIIGFSCITIFLYMKFLLSAKQRNRKNV